MTDRHRHLGWTAFRRVVRVGDLARYEMAYLGGAIAEQATWLAVLVFALEERGAAGVGLVAAVLLVPCVVLAPFATFAGDRFSPQRALGMGYAVEAIAMAAVAVAMWADRPMLAYGASAVAYVAASFVRPVMRSLLPAVTRRPADLVAANVVTGAVEHVGLFLGPLVAAGVLVAASPGAVFAAGFVLTAACAASVLGVRSGSEPLAVESVVTGWGIRTIAREALEGVRTLRRLPRAAILVGIGGCVALFEGAVDVVMVTFAELRLDAGEGVVGLLAGASGLGAVLGTVWGSRLVRVRRQSLPILGAGAGLAAALAVLAAVEIVGPALTVFLGIGVGKAVVHLATALMIQREVPSAVMARVFGVLEGLQVAGLAVGALLFSVLLEGRTLGQALWVAAGAFVVLFGVAGVVLRRLGDEQRPVDDDTVERCADDALFAVLPAPAIERLALSARGAVAARGETVVALGDVGDSYYLITDGSVRVTIGDREMAVLGPGDSFGEIALLRAIPRTATVTALSDARFLTIGRDDFLEAITGHPRSLHRAETQADWLLER